MSSECFEFLYSNLLHGGRLEIHEYLSILLVHTSENWDEQCRKEQSLGGVSYFYHSYCYFIHLDDRCQSFQAVYRHEYASSQSKHSSSTRCRSRRCFQKSPGIGLFREISKVKVSGFGSRWNLISPLGSCCSIWRVKREP